MFFSALLTDASSCISSANFVLFLPRQFAGAARASAGVPALGKGLFANLGPTPGTAAVLPSGTLGGG